MFCTKFEISKIILTGKNNRKVCVNLPYPKNNGNEICVSKTHSAVVLLPFVIVIVYSHNGCQRMNEMKSSAVYETSDDMIRLWLCINVCKA